MPKQTCNSIVTPRLLTVREAALYLAVSERAVWRWLSEGTLKAVRLGRAVRLSRDHLDAITRDGLPGREARR